MLGEGRGKGIEKLWSSTIWERELHRRSLELEEEDDDGAAENTELDVEEEGVKESEAEEWQLVMESECNEGLGLALE